MTDSVRRPDAIRMPARYSTRRQGQPCRVLPFRQGTKPIIPSEEDRLMADGGIYGERQEGSARAAYWRTRGEMAESYKQLAELSTRHVPPEARREEAASSALATARLRLQLEIARFSGNILGMESNDRVEPMLRLTMALFLVERTVQIRDAALEKDNLGIYALYVSIRDDVCRLLDVQYYGMSFKDIVNVYLDIEPGIIAASQLCGLGMVPPAESIPGLYKKKLVAEVSR